MTQIPLAAVIGSPIAHSRSPRLHGHWLRALGLRGHYIPMHVEHTDLETVLKTMPKMGFVGANITIPHKERALALADHVSDRAALIGAANTLTFRDDGSIHADNTDGYGFIENIRATALDWSARSGPAAVLGAGGASRAVILSLLDAGAPEVRLANRTRTRAEALREEFGGRIHIYDWVQAGNMLDGATTVVNTTSLGMEGKPEFRVPLDGLSPHALVTDLVYTPLDTAFLQKARANGCVTVDGLGMLIHQAAPGFERWFGMRRQWTMPRGGRFWASDKAIRHRPDRLNRHGEIHDIGDVCRTRRRRLDADATVHELYAEGGAAVEPVAVLCPASFRDGSIDRTALAQWVASDTNNLKRLESVVHPLVTAHRAAFLEEASTDIVLLDVPLYFETATSQAADMVVVTSTDAETQAARVMARPGMTAEKFALILSRQLPDSEKRARADAVIDTSTMEGARAKVAEIVTNIRASRHA